VVSTGREFSVTIFYFFEFTLERAVTFRYFEGGVLIGISRII